jgi:hypothetical protein
VFGVALALGIPNPREMLRVMDKDTLFYWIVYLNKKQREHSLTDYQIALLNKTVAEMFGGGNVPLKDYLIKFQTEQEVALERIEQNWEFFNHLPKGGIYQEQDENGEWVTMDY